MTQEDKKLLLKDLCARLPYGVIVQYKGHNTIKKNKFLTGSDLDCNMEYYKPYLRSMSSMTDKECIEFLEIRGLNLNSEELKTFRKEKIAIVSHLQSYSRHIDWLNAHHFDYRGLIEKGLAIEVTESNNPYESNM